MQGAEERRLRRMSNTPQGGAIEGNAADDALMVDQGGGLIIDTHGQLNYISPFKRLGNSINIWNYVYANGILNTATHME